MIIGFTGRRGGMSEEQYEAVHQLIGNLIEGYDLGWVKGTHGDCVGADAEFNEICLKHSVGTLVRPCTYENLRAFCEAKEIAKPKAPMARNRDIVSDADVMIACPPNCVKISRGSGTWATIGFTRKAKKPLYIVFPNGKIQRENVDGYA